MATQSVVAAPARSSLFLVLTVNHGAEAAVRSILGDIPALTRAVGFRRPEDSLTTVVGLGSDLWDRMLTAPKPRHLHPFIALHGDTHTAPSTPGDLLIHVRSQHPDTAFEVSRLITDRLSDHTAIADEVHAFRYFDERDLLGFVDGTENPEGDAATDAVLIDDDPDYTGGSYVIVQKYTHDMPAWDSLTAEQQERVIGRTKLDDVQLDDLPANSHVALNSITDDDGNDLDILRFNMAFGSLSAKEFGTYFIGYAKNPAVTERMLHNMFIGDPVGTTDRILDFSTAITGSLFFVPSIDALETLSGGGDS
ncbi:MAG: Dyp-type peroxidase [Dermabacter sp.]|nr:Dyp-type peroxidase [Dermabacter sp.]